MKLYALDFFCGAGGLTRGLLNAGIPVVAGIDVDHSCKQTYEHNNRGARFITADIHNIALAELSRIASGRNLTHALFAGCAPCQPFSSQRKGKPDFGRATLLGEFGRLVEAARPRYVLIENVPGIAKVGGNSTFHRFLGMLTRNGYQYEYGVIDAKSHGVPQTRRRLILIAGRSGKATLPRAKHGAELRPWRTVRNAIEHFPPIGAGESEERVPNHVAAAITEINIERLRATPKDGGDRRSWPKRLRLRCHQGDYNGHSDVYGRMAWDAPAPALTGKCNSISNGRYGHPVQDRAISLREAAAIQTFPDGYRFFGLMTDIAQQIGNAVPVKMAEVLGRHLLDLCAAEPS